MEREAWSQRELQARQERQEQRQQQKPGEPESQHHEKQHRKSGKKKMIKRPAAALPAPPMLALEDSKEGDAKVTKVMKRPAACVIGTVISESFRQCMPQSS